MKLEKIPQINPDWNETQFTNAIRDAVSALGGTSIKLGASQFMAKGTPDTYFTLGGVAFLGESKVYPNKASPIQLRVIRDIRNAVGHAWIITLKKDVIILDTGHQFNDLKSMLKYIYASCINNTVEPDWNVPVHVR